MKFPSARCRRCWRRPSTPRTGSSRRSRFSSSRAFRPKKLQRPHCSRPRDKPKTEHVSGLDSPSIALVGAGSMGGALVRGWIEAVRKGGGLTLTVLEPHFDPTLERDLDAVGANLNPPEAGPVDIIVLAVKPQTFPSTVEATRKF